jgi:hypothetical protein
VIAHVGVVKYIFVFLAWHQTEPTLFSTSGSLLASKDNPISVFSSKMEDQSPSMLTMLIFFS